MQRRTHWHYWLAAIGSAIGLLIVFWPQSLTDPPAEAIPGKVTTEVKNHESSNAGEVDDQHPANDDISVDHASAARGALLNQQAMNAWQTGRIREAMSLFEQAVVAAPNDPAPHSNYGRLLTLMVSYRTALPLLQRARDLTPADPQVWLDLATLYERAQVLEKSWEAHAAAEELVGADAITRDEQGRFVVQGTAL